MGIPYEKKRWNAQVYLTQGEGHNVWGNAPEKSNSATCAHFYERTRYASKPDISLVFKDFRGVKIMNFYDFRRKM